MLLLDARGAAAFAQARLQLLEFLHEEAHVRLIVGQTIAFCGLSVPAHTHAYFNLEKSAGSMKTDSTFCTIFPFAFDSVFTFCHSGSAPNSAQFFLAASTLGWDTI